jgi:hypothetical protein
MQTSPKTQESSGHLLRLLRRNRVALFGVDAVRHFCMCNVYKYRFRASRKNGPEDIEKAEWYMEKLMELNQEENHEKADC